MTDIVRNQTIRIEDYQNHPSNYNKHPPAQIAKIAASLRKFGQVRSVVVWRQYFLAGHGVREAALSLGWETLRADVLPDDYPEERALAYVVADNELSRQSDPDQAALAAILQEVGRVDAELVQAAGFSAQELEQLLRQVGAANGSGIDTEPQIDKAEELREKWQVETGQLWALGEHRLICGDCTDKATVERVMGGGKAGAIVTDSPYGINREGIENDDPEGLRVLFDGCLAVMPAENAVIINFQSPRLFPVWLDALRSAGHKFERLLWMHKSNDVTNPWRGWMMNGEPILISSIGKPEWGKTQAVQDCYIVTHDVGVKIAHTSVKPVDVTENLICHTTGIVFDPFAGSGTTGIACHTLGRKARMIEIDPKYAAVILQRMADHTNQSPVLVEAS